MDGFKTWLPLAFGLLLLCAATGRIRPHLVPDSPSYLDYSFESPQSIASQTRPPGYPAFLKCVGAVFGSEKRTLQVVVVLQILFHAMASASVYREVLAVSNRRTASWTASIAVAVGCTFWDHVSTIATDSPTMSAGVLTATALMRVWRSGSSPSRLLAIVGWSMLAISLRPAALWLIPWAAMMLVIRPGGALPIVPRRKWIDAGWVLTLGMGVIAAWCGFRSIAVGDFGVLPFGQTNLAGVATQWLSNEELASLPGTSGRLGAAIAARRVELSGPNGVRRDGLDLRPVPDPSLAAASTMTIEDRWDAMTYLVVLHEAEKMAEGNVAQNRLVGELNRNIITTYPHRYARWWLLAIRRGIWGGLADIAMHPLFLTGGIVIAIAGVARWTRSGPRTSAVQRIDWRPIGLIAATFAAANLGFIALSSPTIGRFTDAGMVFIPAWLLLIVCFPTAREGNATQVR